MYHVDGLVQDCSNSIANALELLQSCTKSSVSHFTETFHHLPAADLPFLLGLQ